MRLLDSPTVIADAADLFNATTQLLEELLDNVDGVHEREVICAGAVKFKVALSEPPFNAATIVADPLAVAGPTVAVKVALFAPGLNPTKPGTVTIGLLLESRTLAPAPGQAGTVTVQVEVPGAFTVVGEHVKPVTCVASTRLIEVETVARFHVPVTDAIELDISVAVVAVKVADASPGEIETLAGTVRAGLLLLRKTCAALVAGLLSKTVQVVEELLPRLEGAHETEVKTAALDAFRVKFADPPFAAAVRTAA